MKYLEQLSSNTLETIKVGEYFVYHSCSRFFNGFQRAIKVSNRFMVPIGLAFETKEGALDWPLVQHLKSK
jgi:hypothetical protein